MTRTRKKQLTREAVKEIIKCLEKGEVGCHVAKRYNVHESTVSYIKNSVTWKDLKRSEKKVRKPSKRLTDETRKAIEHQILLGVKIASIASEFDVSANKVYNIKYDMMERG